MVRLLTYVTHVVTQACLGTSLSTAVTVATVCLVQFTGQVLVIPVVPTCHAGQVWVIPVAPTCHAGQVLVIPVAPTCHERPLVMRDKYWSYQALTCHALK